MLPEITGVKLSNRRGRFQTADPGKGVFGNSQKISIASGPGSARCSKENVTTGHLNRIPKAKSGLTASF